MTHSIIELDGTITLYKTRNVGATRSIFMEGHYKRLPDGSLEKINHAQLYAIQKLKEEIMIEKTMIDEIEKKIKSSTDDLVNLIKDEFNKQIESRKKARNKRKAAKRKSKR